MHWQALLFFFLINLIKPVLKEKGGAKGKLDCADIWVFPFWSELEFVKVAKGKSDHQYDFTYNLACCIE